MVTALIGEVGGTGQLLFIVLQFCLRNLGLISLCMIK